MHMGTSQIPTLAELEAEIDRRELELAYAQALARMVDPYAKVSDTAIELDGLRGDGQDFVIGIARLTETQKTQAAMRVLHG